MDHKAKNFDSIVNLCKNRGFIFAGSEIYGGLANSWDYGPLGVEFKNNVKKAWLKKFVQESPYNVGLDAAIIMNPQTWITTGHVSSFSDPLLGCGRVALAFLCDAYDEEVAGQDRRSRVISLPRLCDLLPERPDKGITQHR